MNILGPDDPNKPKIGWTIHERSGTIIHHYNPDEDGKIHGPLDSIQTIEGLQKGMPILVAGLFGGYHIMTVVKDDYGVLSAENEGLIALLRFEDGVWCCIGLINKSAIKKVELKSK